MSYVGYKMYCKQKHNSSTTRPDIPHLCPKCGDVMKVHGYVGPDQTEVRCE